MGKMTVIHGIAFTFNKYLLIQGNHTKVNQALPKIHITSCKIFAPRASSCHHPDGFSETNQCDAEKNHTYQDENDELRPYYIQTCTSIENSLGK